jgi:hypothetical protein
VDNRPKTVDNCGIFGKKGAESVKNTVDKLKREEPGTPARLFSGGEVILCGE